MKLMANRINQTNLRDIFPVITEQVQVENVLTAICLRRFAFEPRGRDGEFCIPRYGWNLIAEVVVWARPELAPPRNVRTSKTLDIRTAYAVTKARRFALLRPNAVSDRHKE